MSEPSASEEREAIAKKLEYEAKAIRGSAEKYVGKEAHTTLYAASESLDRMAREIRDGAHREE